MKAALTFLMVITCCLCLQLKGQEKSRKLEYSKKSSINSLDRAKQIQGEDPAGAIDHIQDAIRIAVESNDRFTEGKSYHLLGEINFNSLQYDIAITYLEKAKGIFEAIGANNEIYQTQKLLARAYASNFQYERAKAEYNLVLASAIEKGSINDQIFAHQAIADIYKKEGRLDEALQELDKAEKIGESGNSMDKLVEVKLQRGEILEAQSNDAEALNEYQSSEDLSRTLNNQKGVISSNRSQSRLLNKAGRKSEAVKKQKENLSFLKQESEQKKDVELSLLEDGNEDSKKTEESFLFSEEDPVVEETRANIDIAKTYIELDSAREAIGYLKEAIDLSSGMGALNEEKDAFGLLSEAYVKTGDYAGALLSYKNYVALVDSLYQLKEADILASLDLSKELSKRLQRINSLEKDRDLQEKTIALLESQRTIEKERNNQLRIIIYSLIIGLLLLLALLYFANRNSRQKRITNQLLALKSLRTQMNPHFIFNALNSVNNFISQSDERSANRYLSDFSRLMRLVLENSEHDFIPLENELEIVRLYLSLEHLRFSEKFDYELTISPELQIEKYQIPPMMVQPFIENAVWHGLRYLEGKGKLEVSFMKEDNKLIVKIEDDGIGREHSKAVKTKNQQTNKSTAMRNIKERLNIINSTHQSKVTVKVNDLFDDGRGTKVIISVEQ